MMGSGAPAPIHPPPGQYVPPAQRPSGAPARPVAVADDSADEAAEDEPWRLASASADALRALKNPLITNTQKIIIGVVMVAVVLVIALGSHGGAGTKSGGSAAPTAAPSGLVQGANGGYVAPDDPSALPGDFTN
jgi:hypothetical protein